MSVNKNSNDLPNEESTLMLELKRFFQSFKRLWWISAICAVIFGLVSLVYFKATFQPRYRSDVKFTITPLVSSDATNGASVYSFNYNATLATQMASTFPHILNSGIMKDIVTNDLQRNFSASVSAEAVPDTNIFNVAVTSTSPDDAYEVLQSIINNYPKVAEYIVGDTKMQVIEGAEPELAEEPYNTGEYYTYVLILMMCGVLVGVIAAAIDMKTRRIVADKNDIESYFNGKCICEVPIVDKKRAGNLLRIGRTQSGFSESIRALKQRARNILSANGSKVVGIASATANEGKTTIAYNLARSLSDGEKKVLLIDMDFHNRDIQNSLNRKKTVPNTGIADIAAGKAQLQDVINSVSETFDVMFAGEENIKFKKSEFSEIFDMVRHYYDYIIVDLPTVSVASEAVQIADLCDELMFVVKANAVSPEKIHNALSDMAFSDVHMMGFVLNGAVSSGTSQRYYGGRYNKRRYGYGYSYGYGHYGNYRYDALQDTPSDQSK